MKYQIQKQKKQVKDLTLPQPGDGTPTKIFLNLYFFGVK